MDKIILPLNEFKKLFAPFFAVIGRSCECDLYIQLPYSLLKYKALIQQLDPTVEWIIEREINFGGSDLCYPKEGSEILFNTGNLVLHVKIFNCQKDLFQIILRIVDLQAKRCHIARYYMIVPGHTKKNIDWATVKDSYSKFNKRATGLEHYTDQTDKLYWALADMQILPLLVEKVERI